MRFYQQSPHTTFKALVNISNTHLYSPPRIYVLYKAAEFVVDINIIMTFPPNLINNL